jgi:Uma2 family endonuclease
MTTAKTAAQSDLPRRRFTVDEYYEMARAGILCADERVELLEGEIIEMAPIGDPHVGCVIRSGKVLTIRLGDRADVSIQNPVRLTSGSEPVPDIAVLRPRSDGYSLAKALPDDVHLLIEVSDTTLRYDRGRKLAVYAASGIPEVWIVDLNGARILIFRHPEGRSYAEEIVVKRGGTLSPLAFPDLVLQAEEILG